MNVETVRLCLREIAAETVIAIVLGCPHEALLGSPRRKRTIHGSGTS
jgi:hypothetical protein